MLDLLQTSEYSLDAFPHRSLFQMFRSERSYFRDSGHKKPQDGRTVWTFAFGSRHRASFLLSIEGLATHGRPFGLWRRRFLPHAGFDIAGIFGHHRVMTV